MPNAYPIPQNMEGQGNNNPYRTPFSARRFASDAIRGIALPTPVQFGDRLTGNNIRNLVDRWTGATADRNLQEYNRYMSGQMRNDPGNRGGIANFFRSLFSRGGQNPQEVPQNNPYSASTYGIPGYDHSIGGGQAQPSGQLDSSWAEDLERTLQRNQQNARNYRPPPHQSGGTPMRGRTIAQRDRSPGANNRALEDMAESFLGQDPTSRMNYMNRLSRDMMERMYGNEFK